MPFEPIYKKTRLTLGNPEGTVGIVTLWSKKSEIAAKLDPSQYAAIGNLYSAERGLDLMVRNLLANPQITNLVVTGVDFSRSGIVLLDFFQKGFTRGVTDTTAKPVWRVNSAHEGYIDLDIPESALEALRASVHIQRVPDVSKLDLTSLPKPAATRERAVYLKPEETSRKYAGEYEGHIIRAPTVAGAWLQVLDTILKFGKESGTHYDDQQKELVNLLSIITDENPASLHVPDFLPSDVRHVQEYIPRMTRDLPGGTSSKEYTYGSRMRSWFGIDQVNNAIEKLIREPISRAVVLSLWDPEQDMTLGGSPCLNHVWFRITDGALRMTAIFRSHDMFEGYPENAFALRVLQEEVRAAAEQGLHAKDFGSLGLGPLMILSQSAHLYDDCWERAQRTVDKFLDQYLSAAQYRYDPRGNIIITIEGDGIVVEHTSAARDTLGVYRAKSADEMRNILVRENIIGNTAHAVYVGKELQKAEHAIKLNIHFEQDQPLDLSAFEAAGPSANADRPTAPPVPQPAPTTRSVVKEGVQGP
ncbi:MAG TPA: thymidylate synthase, partial [archaeon]|nr:thymidylate synthase [archaeon]